ncbi:MAG: DUF234 domain-containing protein [Caldilineales bacterium]|nr:DUF234 domain-containing protein [Caldilineales bacterium]MCW5859399.1 hypothetical protein [Caldilineales bacterium]
MCRQRRQITRHLLDFIGAHRWEELRREWVLRVSSAGRLPYLVDQVGSSWTKTSQVDIVGIHAMEKTLSRQEATTGRRRACACWTCSRSTKFWPDGKKVGFDRRYCRVLFWWRSSVAPAGRGPTVMTTVPDVVLPSPHSDFVFRIGQYPIK